MEPDQPDVAEQPKKNEGGITGKGFVKGKSGNPTGRPKGRVSILTHVERLLREGKEVQAKELAQALIDQFKRGNGSAIKEIMARIDGPMPTKLEIEDVSLLTDEERVARIAALADRARERRA